MKRLQPLCISFVLLICSFQLKAQDTSAFALNVFVPEINEPVQWLQKHLWVGEDKAGKLLLKDLLQNKVSDTFFTKVTKISDPDPFSVWWCKLTIDPSFSSMIF